MKLGVKHERELGNLKKTRKKTPLYTAEVIELNNMGLRGETDGHVGGGLGPPLKDLEGNPPKRGPTTGETGKEGWIGIYKQREHVCLVRTPMADSASTATARPR